MGTAPMWRLLATMSVPPTLAIVVMAMYSIVDRAFVGNAVGVARRNCWRWASGC